MAQLSIVEDPRPRRSRSNHPSHQHDLRKTDMREKYKWTNGLWRCDLCGIESNSNKLTSLHSTGHSENSDEKEVADSAFAFHCDLCSYDVCSLCFYGRLHPFHNHKVKKAKVVLIYPETGGQWRCDACLKIFTELTAPMSNHCSLCEVDICDKCFIGSWKSVHHGSHYSLRAVAERFAKRNHAPSDVIEESSLQIGDKATSETGNLGLQVSHICSHCKVAGCCGKDTSKETEVCTSKGSSKQNQCSERKANNLQVSVNKKTTKTSVSVVPLVSTRLPEVVYMHTSGIIKFFLLLFC